MVSAEFHELRVFLTRLLHWYVIVPAATIYLSLFISNITSTALIWEVLGLTCSASGGHEES